MPFLSRHTLYLGSYIHIRKHSPVKFHAFYTIQIEAGACLLKLLLHFLHILYLIYVETLYGSISNSLVAFTCYLIEAQIK